MASEYGWLITKDHIGAGRVGTVGPRDISDGMVADLKAGKGRKFRTLDCDGEVYYSGRYIGPEGEAQFGPLDDFARPDAGATDIQYREGGKWVTL